MSSIIIDNAGFLSHQDIHQTFDGNLLGSVIQVTILPEYDPVSRQTINKAYVLIDEWYDTESAFNFIKETQTARGSLMHCNNNAFCVVKQSAATVYHSNNFRSKWTQRFQNLAKQELNIALKEYNMEMEEVLSDEALKKVFPLTYDGLMMWHENDRKEKDEENKKIDELNQFFIDFFRMDRK